MKSLVQVQLVPSSNEELYYVLLGRLTLFDSIFSSGSLIKYIKNNIKDPWINTPFEGYVFMSPKQKGEFGERFVSKYFKNLGHTVNRAKTNTAGHDRIINGILTEIKFSLATRSKIGEIKKDVFVINHVSKDKDWERLVFFGINPKEEDCRFFWFSKEDFVKYLNEPDCLFGTQQGGKSINNDDYICARIKQLMEKDFIKTLKEW